EDARHGAFGAREPGVDDLSVRAPERDEEGDADDQEDRGGGERVTRPAGPGRSDEQTHAAGEGPGSARAPGGAPGCRSGRHVGRECTATPAVLDRMARLAYFRTPPCPSIPPTSVSCSARTS